MMPMTNAASYFDVVEPYVTPMTNAASYLNIVEPYILSAATINLDNVVANYRNIKSKLARGITVGAVVKADSYGFGAIPITKRLYAEGCRYFFVATIDEGIEVRQILKDDAEIFVLAGLLDNTEDVIIQHKLIPVLNDLYHVDLWINYSKKIGKKLKAVLQVDTGIHRNGLSENDFYKQKNRILENLELVFVMSHLACADDVHSEMNKHQLAKFKGVLSALGGVRGSFSATNGMFLGKEYQFDIVRPGKSLYGFAVRKDLVGSLLPVADLFARIVQINQLEVGDSVGYGATFTATKPITAITIGMGYADGFMRKFSGFGHGFLGGKKIPMIGRISMDYLALDASTVDRKYIKMGNWVALTNSTDYTLEKWALELGTIPHEIGCRIGRRVKKVYIGEV